MRSISNGPDVLAPPSNLVRSLSLMISLAQVLLWFLVLWFNLSQSLPAIWAPLQIAIQSFLFVGLFIVAHDCMHGIVGPASGRVGRRLGQLCAFLFAGFSYSQLKKNHDKHHDFLVSHQDPDYTENSDEHFFVWLWTFIKRYFGLKEFLILHIHVVIAYLISGSFLKVIIFFAIPSWIASLQLFYFGTYLPHRNFHQNHSSHVLKARNNDYPVWLSFITCYHFGYHQEHHKYPYLAWWRLPQALKLNKQKN